MNRNLEPQDIYAAILTSFRDWKEGLWCRDYGKKSGGCWQSLDEQKI